VFVVENLDAAALAADGSRASPLVLTHAKLRGATGGWTSPLALSDYYPRIDGRALS
jgi:hypothetical protein